jgi:hypothetical protein
MEDNNEIIITVPLIPFFDKPNINGHIYTKECIDNMVTLFNKRSNRVPMYGQIGYPVNQLTHEIEMDGKVFDASHVVKKVWRDDNQMMGEIQILETPKGVMLKRMLDVKKEMIVFRQRSIGSVNEDGTMNITHLISFDAISYQDDSFNPDVLNLLPKE